MKLTIVEPGPARETYLPLLMLADDSEQQVRSYLQNGILFVAQLDGNDVGATLAIPTELDTIELRAVAVDPRRQHQGVGKQMLALVLADLNDRGYARTTVGTGNSSINQIAFYQKAGFRMWTIERDHFTTEKGYSDGLAENGIPLRDMIWFERTN